MDSGFVYVRAHLSNQQSGAGSSTIQPTFFGVSRLEGPSASTYQSHSLRNVNLHLYTGISTPNS